MTRSARLTTPGSTPGVGAEERSVAPKTSKGRETRERIVVAAAGLMHHNGVAGTGTPDVRNTAQVSSSQIYHYFADKDALTRAVIAFQHETLVSAQRRLLAGTDGLAALHTWRDAVLSTANDARGPAGCPLGTLSAELSNTDPVARAALADAFSAWSSALRDGLQAMVENKQLRPETPVADLALALLSAVQGGLLLTQVHRDTSALRAGLDAVIAQVVTYATGPTPHPRA